MNDKNDDPSVKDIYGFRSLYEIQSERRGVIYVTKVIGVSVLFMRFENSQRGQKM